MIRFLDNHTIGVIGIAVPALIAIAAIVVPILVNRRSKRLWYKRVIYPVIEEEIHERMQVTFDGEVVPNVYVSVISLRYEGPESLIEEHFREPISFDYGEAKVLDVEVIAKHPEGVNPSMNVHAPNKVVLDPLALNDGNEITARVLSTGPKRRPRVMGHIVGIKEFQDFDKKQDRQ